MASATSIAPLALQIVRGPDSIRDAARALGLDLTAPCLDPVADFVASVARGNAQRLVLSSAPRHGKTTSIEVATAWLLVVRPGARVGIVSCTAFLAELISRRIRALVESAFGLTVTRDQRAADMWSCSNGSSLRAVGVGTALVGVGFDVLICDDLIPSMAAAQSEAERVKAEVWFESTALGRMEPGASALVCAHRWSVDDLSGRLISRGWRWTNVPAVCPATGQPAWPSRWSIDELRAKEIEVGPIAWAALWMGMPRAKGGTVFSAAPVFYDEHWMRTAIVARTARIVIACDPAASARTRADYSVVLVGAVTEHVEELATRPRPDDRIARGDMLVPMRRPIRHVRSVLNVIDAWRGQIEIPDLVDKLVAMQRAWGATVGVEAVAGFRSVAQYLRRANPSLSVHELRATTDKYTRAIPASAAWARGDIQLRPSAPWLGWFVHEVGAFTGTGIEAHDDAPDCLVHLHTMVGLAEHAERSRRRQIDLSNALPFGT